MKKITILSLLFLLNFQFIKANDIDSDLISIAKIYRDFMFRNNPSEYAYEQLENIKSKELISSKSFIKETITPKNNLTNKEFLSIPDENTLYQLYIIRRIDWNLREEKPKSNNDLITDIREKDVPRYELVDNYYGMLFVSLGNKNQPFNLSNIDFRINDYQLKDDTEKGIFYLKAMKFCGSTIWGYMNVVNPPNYEKALEYINNFPKFNDQEYYKYQDFGFTDFEMEIEKDKGIESYKEYYINNFYETLLYNLMCLNQEKEFKDKKMDLLLGSILRESNYYKYSKYEEVLNGLFREIDQN